MILSNTEIIAEINRGVFKISGLAGSDPTQPPFNTSAVDLRLAAELLLPQPSPMAFDLRKGKIANLLAQISKNCTLSEDQPYALKPHTLVLAQTMETVDFPLSCGYAARVEGRSSLARCGLLVHFTAPTIHAGFKGPITLEIMNFGPNDFLLFPGLQICQLIVEQVKGTIEEAPNQFKGQRTPAGEIGPSAT